MNKYFHLGHSFDDVMTHEIGHLLMAIEHNCLINRVAINLDIRNVSITHSPAMLQAIQAIKSNFTLQTLNNYRDEIYKQLLRMVSGDVMLALYKNDFVIPENLTQSCLSYKETDSVFEYQKVGFIQLDDLIQECARFLISKKDDFYIWKWILWKDSRDEEVDGIYSYLKERYNTFLGPFRRLHVFRIRSTLFVLRYLMFL